MSRRRFDLTGGLTVRTAAQLTAASGTLHGTAKLLGNEGISKAIFALNVTTHSNADANETYQFYITSGIKTGSGQAIYWDLGAFVVVSGADAQVTDVMFVGAGSNAPTSVVANGTLTGIAPTLSCASTNTRGTITTAVVREGYFGDWINWTLIGGGTTPGPITFEIEGLIWN
jgi:hypothetical protein